MAETDILNASVAWDSSIKDSISPDFGFETLRRSQLAITKPAFGQPYSRTVGNGGHSTAFSWLNRSDLCAQKLKQWAEQFEDGFFTVIDHDMGRHYVGRFVGDMPIVHAGNDRNNIQGWQFEEVAGCPMLEYPSNWENWAVLRYPFDNFGRAAVATSSANWVRPAAVVDGSGVLQPQPSQMLNTAPAVGDSATFEYRGYGFRLWAGSGPGWGQVNLYVDGAFVQLIDLYSAAEQGTIVVYENAAMALDIHRVQVVLPATMNVASTGTGMLLDKFEVMR